jgi:hypothetical protein
MWRHARNVGTKGKEMFLGLRLSLLWLWRAIYSEDGSNMFVWNVYELVPNYAPLYPRRIIFFRKSYLLLRITGVLDFSHRPVFLGVETRRFGNWICFHPQVKGEKIPTHLGPLERANLNHWTTTVRFKGPNYCDSPISKVLHFIRSVRLIEG